MGEDVLGEIIINIFILFKYEKFGKIILIFRVGSILF